jgi:CheY-like chemotaxis protein
MRDNRSRILLVEDQESTRDGLAEALALAGYLVDRFDAGGRALEYLGTGPKPDVILLDLYLRSDMDGWQFAETVKANARAAQIPIVAMTGARLDDQEWDRTRFEAFFFKPVDLRSLLRTIERLIELRGGQVLGDRAQKAFIV